MDDLTDKAVQVLDDQSEIIEMLRHEKTTLVPVRRTYALNLHLEVDRLRAENARLATLHEQAADELAEALYNLRLMTTQADTFHKRAKDAEERPDFMTDDHVSLINQLQAEGLDESHCVFAIEARYPTIGWEQAIRMVKHWESLFGTCSHCGDIFNKGELLFEEENGFYGVCDECLADMQD